jgi:glycosyltransferase involved in cell wall biosynthesis
VSAARQALVAWRVLRHEGAAAVAARWLDRRADAQRRAAFVRAPEGWRPRVPVPVLNLLPAPAARRLGGVPIQLMARLREESAHRPVALLAPHGGGWRLEVAAAGERHALSLEGPGPAPDVLASPALGAVVERAAGIVGATVLHVEDLADLPLATLLALRDAFAGLVVSLHDFAAFCPRPHLLERPAEAFCHYCRDLPRCGRCLAVDWPLDGVWQGERRSVGERLLAACDAVVFPSPFLRDTHRALFPAAFDAAAAAAPRVLVLPPTSGPLPVLPAPPESRRLRHVAFVGSVKPHKGGLVFAETVERLAGEGLRWSVYGGGDAELLQRLRRLPDVRVRGYYRAGSLPRHLHDDGVDLALLLSIWPETHALTLDECRAAGVPALGFAHGALGERLREGGGVLVPPDTGAAGVAAALRDLLRAGRAPDVPPALRAPRAAPDTAALAGLYASLQSPGVGRR